MDTSKAADYVSIIAYERLQYRLAAAEAERDRLKKIIDNGAEGCCEEFKRILIAERDKLKAENERLRKIITEEVNLLYDEGEHVWADCLEDDLYDKAALREVDGEKDIHS